MKCPCHGCKDRTKDCHGACARYGEFAARCEEIRQKRHAESAMNDYQARQIVKAAIYRQKHDRKGSMNG